MYQRQLSSDTLASTSSIGLGMQSQTQSKQQQSHLSENSLFISTTSDKPDSIYYKNNQTYESNANSKPYLSLKVPNSNISGSTSTTNARRKNKDSVVDHIRSGKKSPSIPASNSEINPPSSTGTIKHTEDPCWYSSLNSQFDNKPEDGNNSSYTNTNTQANNSTSTNTASIQQQNQKLFLKHSFNQPETSYMMNSQQHETLQQQQLTNQAVEEITPLSLSKSKKARQNPCRIVENSTNGNGGSMLSPSSTTSPKYHLQYPQYHSNPNPANQSSSQQSSTHALTNEIQFPRSLTNLSTNRGLAASTNSAFGNQSSHSSSHSLFSSGSVYLNNKSNEGQTRVSNNSSSNYHLLKPANSSPRSCFLPKSCQASSNVTNNSNNPHANSISATQSNSTHFSKVRDKKDGSLYMHQTFEETIEDDHPPAVSLSPSLHSFTFSQAIQQQQQQQSQSPPSSQSQSTVLTTITTAATSSNRPLYKKQRSFGETCQSSNNNNNHVGSGILLGTGQKSKGITSNSSLSATGNITSPSASTTTTGMPSDYQSVRSTVFLYPTASGASSSSQQLTSQISPKKHGSGFPPPPSRAGAATGTINTGTPITSSITDSETKLSITSHNHSHSNSHNNYINALKLAHRKQISYSYMSTAPYTTNEPTNGFEDSTSISTSNTTNHHQHSNSSTSISKSQQFHSSSTLSNETSSISRQISPSRLRDQRSGNIPAILGSSTQKSSGFGLKHASQKESSTSKVNTSSTFKRIPPDTLSPSHNSQQSSSSQYYASSSDHNSFNLFSQAASATANPSTSNHRQKSASHINENQSSNTLSHNNNNNNTTTISKNSSHKPNFSSYLLNNVSYSSSATTTNKSSPITVTQSEQSASTSAGPAHPRSIFSKQNSIQIIDHPPAYANGTSTIGMTSLILLQDSGSLSTLPHPSPQRIQLSDAETAPPLTQTASAITSSQSNNNNYYKWNINLSSQERASSLTRVQNVQVSLFSPYQEAEESTQNTTSSVQQQQPELLIQQRNINDKEYNNPISTISLLSNVSDQAEPNRSFTSNSGILAEPSLGSVVTLTIPSASAIPSSNTPNIMMLMMDSMLKKSNQSDGWDSTSSISSSSNSTSFQMDRAADISIEGEGARSVRNNSSRRKKSFRNISNHAQNPTSLHNLVQKSDSQSNDNDLSTHGNGPSSTPLMYKMRNKIQEKGINRVNITLNQSKKRQDKSNSVSRREGHSKHESSKEVLQSDGTSRISYEDNNHNNESKQSEEDRFKSMPFTNYSASLKQPQPIINLGGSTSTVEESNNKTPLKQTSNSSLTKQSQNQLSSKSTVKLADPFKKPSTHTPSSNQETIRFDQRSPAAPTSYSSHPRNLIQVTQDKQIDIEDPLVQKEFSQIVRNLLRLKHSDSLAKSSSQAQNKHIDSSNQLNQPSQQSSSQQQSSHHHPSKSKNLSVKLPNQSNSSNSLASAKHDVLFEKLYQEIVNKFENKDSQTDHQTTTAVGAETIKPFALQTTFPTKDCVSPKTHIRNS